MSSNALALPALLPALLPTAQRHSCGSSAMPAQQWVCGAFAGRQQAECCLCSPSLRLLCPGQKPTQAVLLCRPQAWHGDFVDHGRLTSGAAQRLDCTEQQHLPDTSLHTSLALPAGT